jgi:hypothetical protein
MVGAAQRPHHEGMTVDPARRPDTADRDEHDGAAHTIVLVAVR